jgi:dihydroflavonol-4-reductase
VVLTSSVAAIYGDTIDSKNVPDGIFDESVWNTSSTPTQSEYSYSKTVAEKEAWKICGEQNRWDLVVINPSLVLGPALNPHSDFESKKFMLQMGNGDLKSGVPDIKLGIVDVRNVGEAHLNAGYNPDASGRYIISSDSMDFLTIGKHLLEEFGNKYPIPKRVAPKFLVWLIAPMIGIKRNFVSRNVGYAVHFNNTKSKKELAIDYIPVKDTVIDFFQQFIDEKLI